MKRSLSPLLSATIGMMVLSGALLFHPSCIYPRDGGKPDTSNESGIGRLFSELGKCCRCHLEKWSTGSEPLEHAASYTRHRKQGRCRTHVGNTFQERDASSCPDHADKQVQRLLELCRSAVTYHLPTGEIDVVEADPTAGKRDYVPAGPYAGRITQKPLVERAQLCHDAQHTVPYIRLLDSNDRVLMVFECTKPLKQIETEAGVAYLIDNHMVHKAELYVDMNEITTAIEG